MIETRVRVMKTEAGSAWVVPSETSGCGGCHSRSSCGIGGMSKLFRTGRQSIKVDCADARPGEELVVSMDEGDLVKASLLAYLLPAVTAITGAALASDHGDAASALAMLVGALAGLGLARILSRKPRMDARRAPACSH